ncbi:MAG: glutamate racemase [Candidatus Velthaea sp.]
MLGLYDSGLGGLTVLKALRAAGVTQDIIYFADQAHVPYGDRTDDDLHHLLSDNFAFLATQAVDAVVMACNTSCAVASRLGWPRTAFPVLDLIANAGKSPEIRRFSRIAVFGTAATIRSGAYGNAIRAAVPAAGVLEIAAPALVPLVEAGKAGSVEAADAVRTLCRALPADIDAIVYGCTHYPMLQAEFRSALGENVALIDPAQTQAAAAAALIRARGLAPGGGGTHYLTNGDLMLFERNVRAWTHDSTGRVSLAASIASEGLAKI